MGKGGQAEDHTDSCREISWSEVRKHTSRDDKWIVIDDDVYDVSRWQFKHPGGLKVISHYAGQDASEAFTAFHNDQKFVRKYLRAMHVGRLVQERGKREQEIRDDLANVRKTAEKQGFFKPSVLFFTLMVAHIFAFEILAYVILWKFGTGWLPVIASLACYTICQAQVGWTQHDFGHLSVFNSTLLNQVLHRILMSFTKGASSSWWNHMHYQHHSKPNVIGKDPDVRLEALFVLGEKMAEQVAKKKTTMPYNKQHKYFFAIGPPLLFPVYFQFMLFYYTITRRKWLDLAVTVAFYVKFFYLYAPMFGFFGAFLYHFILRVFESHWFVWVSQSNHLPMNIDEDRQLNWLELQTHATCNIERSPFNDWFTGHLNFQIEHHLFPTMPRHNLYKVAPLVRSVCEKHGIDYKVKPMTTAFVDIYRRLESSGQMWLEFKDAYHMD